MYSGLFGPCRPGIVVAEELIWLWSLPGGFGTSRQFI